MKTSLNRIDMNVTISSLEAIRDSVFSKSENLVTYEFVKKLDLFIHGLKILANDPVLD